MFRSVSNISLKLNDFLSTSQRKTYFIAFATLLFVIIITLGGILPAFSSLTFQSEENARRQDAITKLEKKLETAKKLTTEYSQEALLVDYFSKIFPNNIDQQYLISRINTMVTRNNSYLASINFSQEPSSNFLKTDLSLEVSGSIVSIFLEGNLSDLQNILNEIEDSRRVFNIVSIFFDKKDILKQQQESFQRGDSTMNLQVEVYYYKSNLTN